MAKEKEDLVFWLLAGAVLLALAKQEPKETIIPRGEELLTDWLEET